MSIKGIEKHRCRSLLVCITCVTVVIELMISDLFRTSPDYALGRLILVQIPFVDVELKVLHTAIKTSGFHITIIKLTFLS